MGVVVSVNQPNTDGLQMMRGETEVVRSSMAMLIEGDLPASDRLEVGEGTRPSQSVT